MARTPRTNEQKERHNVQEKLRRARRKQEGEQRRNEEEQRQKEEEARKKEEEVRKERHRTAKRLARQRKREQRQQDTPQHHQLPHENNLNLHAMSSPTDDPAPPTPPPVETPQPWQLPTVWEDMQTTPRTLVRTQQQLTPAQVDFLERSRQRQHLTNKLAILKVGEISQRDGDAEERLQQLVLYGYGGDEERTR